MTAVIIIIAVVIILFIAWRQFFKAVNKHKSNARKFVDDMIDKNNRIV